MPLKVYILDRFARRNPLYTSWIDDCRWPIEIVDTLPSEWSPPADAGLVVTHLHYQWETVSALRRILEQQRVPILVLSDGILEYRNTFENPTIAPGSIFQPLMGHKLACLGRAPARTLEAWGNAGKCEIVGHPRFDRLQERPALPVQVEGPFRLLITTARTPAFTPTQQQAVIAGLSDLKVALSETTRVAGRPLECRWMLDPTLLRRLGLERPAAPETDGNLRLSDAIELSDAVITTPSTVYLESVLLRRPTAILDYTNRPTYVRPAWSITSRQHIAETLASLAEPPAARMQYQRIELQDQVELNGGALSRLDALMEAMIQAGVQARERQQSIWLPPRILSDPQRGIARVEEDFDIQSLFPQSPVHAEPRVRWLQQELAQAIHRLGELPAQLHKKNQYIDFVEQHADSVKVHLEEALQREQKLLETLELRCQDLDTKTRHIEYMESQAQEIQQRIDAVRQREQQIQQLLELRRQDLARKSAHIEELHQLLAQSQGRHQQTRQELQELQQHVRQLARQLLSALPTGPQAEAGQPAEAAPTDRDQRAA